MKININENIKKYRKNKKITQSELGKMIDKSLRMIQKYESGEVVPSFDVIIDIAKALDISHTALVEDKRTKEDILNDVKNILDNTDFPSHNVIYPMGNNELVAIFRNILFNLGIVGPDPTETSDKTLFSVLSSDEFKKHTQYLIDTEKINNQ